MQNELVTNKDIIRNVSEKLNVDEPIVRDVFNNNIEFIKHTVDNTDEINIKVPYVGNFFFHLRTYLRLVYRKKEGKKLDNYEEVILNNMAPKERKLKEFEKAVRYEGKRPYDGTKHSRKKLTRVKWHTGGKLLPEIEELQNELFNSR